MKKWKRWILIMSIIGVVLSLKNLAFNPDVKFIHQNQKHLEEWVIDDIDSERQEIHSITFRHLSAEGGYTEDGWWTQNYYISVEAYANNNPEYSMMVYIDFPEATIGPFTLIKFRQPSKMEDWEISVVPDDTEPWRKKAARDEERRERELLEFQLKYAEEVKRLEKHRPYIDEWLQVHQQSFISTLEYTLYSEYVEHPELKEIVGSVESINYHKIEHMSGDQLAVDLGVRFQKFPDSYLILTGDLLFDDTSYQDLNKGARFSFTGGHYFFCF